MSVPEKLPGPGRLEAFSDGVIAIIITIMVLELKLAPEVGDLGLWTGLIAPLAPKLVSYAMSFLVVAIMWVNHHALMATLHRATRTVLWLNNHLLFWMSLIPFTTGYVGEHPYHPHAVAAYGFVLAASTGSFALLRWQAAKQAGDNPALRVLHREATQTGLVGFVLYVASVPMAFVSVYLAFGLFVVAPGLLFLPSFWARARADGSTA